MENFEAKLRDLFARKRLTDSADFVPSLRDSLEALLDHVCEKVLAPAFAILTEQEQFSSSTFKSYDGIIGDALDDSMADRRVATIRISRLQEPLFEYLISFDGDHEGVEACLYRKVAVIRTSEFTVENPAPHAFDFMENEIINENTLGKTPLDPDADAIHSIKEYASFPTLELDEVVRLVQEDFYLVCHTLL